MVLRIQGLWTIDHHRKN